MGAYNPVSYTEGRVPKGRLVDGTQQPGDRRLKEAVLDCRDAKRPELFWVAGLRYVNPPHGGRVVGPALEAFHEVRQVALQVLAVCRHADPVNAWGAASVHLREGLLEEFHRQVVRQGGEPLTQCRLGFLGDAFQSRVRPDSSSV